MDLSYALKKRGQQSMLGGGAEAGFPVTAQAPMNTNTGTGLALAQAMDNHILQPVRHAGKWWADRAESQNDNTNVIEALNPVTAMGSAMGSVHKYAGEGDPLGVGVNAAASLPIFVGMRGAAGALRGAERLLPPATREIAAQTGSAAYDIGLQPAAAAPVVKPKPKPQL